MATTVANPTDLSLASESVANSQPPALAAGQTQTIQTTTAPGLTTSSMPSARDVLAQPAVRKSMPAIIGLLTLAIFIIAYSWVKEPLYRGIPRTVRV